MMFQYPLADRRGCGNYALKHHPDALAFQYPLADRRGCGVPSKDAPAVELSVSVSSGGS